MSVPQHGRPPIGALEGLVTDVAVGWAVDPAAPDRRLVIEVLCDGYPVALDRADIFRPDLRARPGIEVEGMCCGFEIALPGQVLLQGRVLTARLANTAWLLAGETRIGEAPDVAALRRRAARGEVQAAGLRLFGWIDPIGYHPGPMRVQAFEGQRAVAEGVADLPVPRSAASGVRPRARNFVLRLPLWLADGRPHDITVRDGAGDELPGSPVTVAAWPMGAADAVWRSASVPGLPEKAVRELRTVSAALDAVEDVQRASVSFQSYPEWAAAYPPPSPAPALPADLALTVILHGPGDAAASRASLGPLSEGVRVIKTRDGTLAPDDWPLRGVVVPLAAGDRLTPGALGRLWQAMTDAGAGAAFGDSEQPGPAGAPSMPWFKPCWDPDLFLSQAYVFGALMVAAGSAGPEADLGAALVAALARAAPTIVRVPNVLHVQAATAGPGAAPMPPGWSAARLATVWPPAVAAGARAEPMADAPWLARTIWPRPDPAPRVAVMIPTRDGADMLRTAVEGCLSLTDYPALDVMVLDNGSTEAATHALFDELRARGVRVVDCPGPFNFSAINNRGAEAAGDADLLCLLNNDIEIVEPGWLDEMVRLLMRPGTGAVGAKLTWSEGTVQHGGVVLGIDGGAAHVGIGVAAGEPGYGGTNATVRQWSAVTGACLLLRRDDYLALGGLDARAFAVNFNDVDLCLRLRERGLSVVWTPHAVLHHHESRSRGEDTLPEKAARANRELEALRRRWGAVLLDDPFYHPALNRDGAPFEGLAVPPTWAASDPGAPGGVRPRPRGRRAG